MRKEKALIGLLRSLVDLLTEESWYSYLPDYELGVEMKNWWISPKPWVSIMDGSLVEKITDIAVRVYKAFSDAAPNQLHLLLEGDSVISTTHPDPITP